MSERHIPRRIRILGVTTVIAGIATSAAGGFIVHQQPEEAKNEIVAGSIVMLTGGIITMSGGAILVRESPDQDPKK